MKLENITITASIDGQPVMVVLDDNQRAILPHLIASCDKTRKCRLIKLDTKEYTLSKPSFLAESATGQTRNEIGK